MHTCSKKKKKKKPLYTFWYYSIRLMQIQRHPGTKSLGHAELYPYIHPRTQERHSTFISLHAQQLLQRKSF